MSSNPGHGIGGRNQIQSNAWCVAKQRSKGTTCEKVKIEKNQIVTKLVNLEKNCKQTKLQIWFFQAIGPSSCRQLGVLWLDTDTDQRKFWFMNLDAWGRFHKTVAYKLQINAQRSIIVWLWAIIVG